MELAVVIGKKGKHIKVRWKGQCHLSLTLGGGWHLPAPDPALPLIHHLWPLTWDQGFEILCYRGWCPHDLTSNLAKPPAPHRPQMPWPMWLASLWHMT